MAIVLPGAVRERKSYYEVSSLIHLKSHLLLSILKASVIDFVLMWSTAKSWYISPNPLFLEMISKSVDHFVLAWSTLPRKVKNETKICVYYFNWKIYQGSRRRTGKKEKQEAGKKRKKQLPIWSNWGLTQSEPHRDKHHEPSKYSPKEKEEGSCRRNIPPLLFKAFPLAYNSSTSLGHSGINM